MRLKQETDCGITVDFSHLYARQQEILVTNAGGPPGTFASIALEEYEKED